MGGGGLASNGFDAGGRLILAGTPIGNVADVGPRLTDALESAEVVAAEDTRRLRRLAADLGVRIGGRVCSYYEAVEAARTPELLRELAGGRSVLLITDAGMPGVSDPGYRLVSGAVAAGVPVTVIPGPSAVTAALAVSGLPSDRFCFEGFPPRKAGERRRQFAELAGERRTLVFFESRHRLGATLSDLAAAFGPDRSAALCRELTKTHEEVIRGDLEVLVEWAQRAATGPVGEVTLVVAGAPAGASAGGSGGASVDSAARVTAAQLVAEVDRLAAAGEDRKRALAIVARRFGVPKREVWSAVHEPGSPRSDLGPPAAPPCRP